MRKVTPKTNDQNNNILTNCPKVGETWPIRRREPNRHELIAAELEMHENSIQDMTTTLRNGIVAQEPNVILEGTVECDEVYVVAGHQGHPESVKKNAAPPKTQAERPARPWYRRDGQAADFRDDSAWRPVGVACVGQRSSGDDSADPRTIHPTGNAGEYGRIRY
jgi:hypothetical protein